MHSLKRKRLDAGNATLTKPFRSPLHLSSGEVRNNTSPPAGDQQSNDSLQHKHGAPHTKTVYGCPPSVLSPSSQFPSSPDQNKLLHSPLSQRQRNIHLHAASRRSQHLAAGSDYVELQKKHSALALNLTEVSQEFEITKQALKYITTSDDLGIARLIGKWRSVVRELVEELYAVAVDRINKMGGVDAWRERYDKSSNEPHGNGSWGFAGEQEYDSDDLTAEQKEQLDIAREEAEKEEEKYGLHKDTQAEVRQQNDSFTMATLLKQLNIDFEVVGYDGTTQTWVD